MEPGSSLEVDESATQASESEALPERVGDRQVSTLEAIEARQKWRRRKMSGGRVASRQARHDTTSAGDKKRGRTWRRTSSGIIAVWGPDPVGAPAPAPS